ncbi:MAG: hypothetical protein M0041_01035 [Nitrospiraceae bacterium]|nr:hypothetical protein [Nitrospiraceae bacterium]
MRPRVENLLDRRPFELVLQFFDGDFPLQKGLLSFEFKKGSQRTVTAIR